MPQVQRAKTQAVTDNDIAIHSDKRSTVVVTTTLNTASESEMKARFKRALAECPETDDLYSDTVHDDMRIGNKSKIAEMESAMAEHERESDTTLRKHQEWLYDLHNAVNRLGQQNHT
ncbi:hypothetical protein BDV32DRAFT_149941 [Aspergillus pseudonomiae]|nr:hypothetical protein BDV32DRAFT_149941 [Aspergillus pseudonomiae]